jgi:hypothetical protein
MEPLTYAQAWRDQDDLDDVCRDRPLDTNEIIGQNTHYGNDRVIKTYAGVPADEALRIALPHGLELSHHPQDAPYYRSLARLPVIGYYAYDAVAHYRAFGIRNLLWPMAAPFVYASKMVDAGAPAERRGTIFFPSHSSEWHQPSQDFADLATRLAALPDIYQPVTVCVYFLDYRVGAHEPFLNSGLRVVSAGHGLDPQFLFRLWHLLRGHEYAASNDLGSSCYFAIHAGCKYFYLADRLTWAREDERDDVRAAGALARLEQLSGQSYEQQRKEADRYLGPDNLLEPSELRRLLCGPSSSTGGGCASIVDRDRRRSPCPVPGACGPQRDGCRLL